MFNSLHRILKIMFIVLATGVVAFSQTATAPSAGDGSAGNPYQIATLDNLYWLTQNSSKWSDHFKQTSDIDASSSSSWNSGAGFSPIGSFSGTYFQGTYDGDGHTISGIYISQSTSNYIGMFGFCFGATIDSLGVINEQITQNNSAQGYVGGLLGGGSNDTIVACYTTGSVEGVSFVGGLVGYVQGYNGSNSIISVSYSADSVTTINGNAGGLAGKNQALISNCYSTGAVGNSTNIGGLVGYNDSTLSHCYSTGKVTGYLNAGAIVGVNAYVVDTCFWNKDSSSFSGISVESGSATDTVGKTTIQMKDPFTFTAAGWDTSYWYMGDSINSGYPYLKWQNPGGTHLVTAVAPDSGTGAPTAPYQIASLDNLYWLTQNPSDWDLYYIQTTNIDASQTSGWNLGTGFSPIGNATTTFDGNYDGRGHTITGLHISYSDSGYVGLFGSTEATIDSLGLVNENISGGSDVGGLVGYSYFGTISNCYNTGAVSGNGATGRIGGLVGVNNDGTISEDYSSASVSGQTVVGGLVGYNITSIVPAIIRNSYSLGSVSATDHVGGLVGENDGGFPVGDTIGECYSIGSVSASGGSPNYAGGLVGANLNSGVIDSSYWDMGTSGQSTSAGGTGETDANMKLEATYSGWDFAALWSISSGVNNDYPYLQSLTDHSLAVQATGFTATSAAGSVTLTWQTQSEVDNAGFNVLRELQTTNQEPRTTDYELVSSYTSDDSLRGLGTSSTGRAYDFTDNHVTSGLTYDYLIQSVSTNGKTKDLSTLSVTVGVPKTYALYQNYPNPFNPTTVISYQLSASSHVSLKIYDILGRVVATLVDGQQNAGAYKVNFNASRYASGVYFYRINAVGKGGQRFAAIKKLMLVK